MFKNIVSKYNINVPGMIRNGTVAVITMFGSWILFGYKNIMLAFPIALTSTVLSRQNFYVKPFSKITRIMVLDLLIVLVAYLSSINMWTGIVINFIAIFLIMYTIASPYDPTFYKPFIMLYVFTQYATVSIEELPNRLLTVVFGCIVIILASLIKKVNEKIVLGNSITAALKNIKDQLETIIEGKYDSGLNDKCSKLMRDLAYKVYITRYKKYLTTELGTIQFRMFIYIEYLNQYLDTVNEAYKNSKITREEILISIKAVDKILIYSKAEKGADKVYTSVEKHIENLKYKSQYMNEIKEIILGILTNIRKVEMMNKKDINKVYKDWERKEYDMPKDTFKEYFNKDSIRFKFAIRMSITMTISLLFAEVLGFYKVIWAIITIMSIMQPYYEDTVTKAVDRIKGNIIAIIFTGVFINLVNIKWVTIVILIISLYLLYAFKEYSRISLFAAIASICVSSLSENINKLIFYRVGYVIVGVLIVLLVNKYLFPYKLDDGIKQLISKIDRYIVYLSDDCKELLNGKGNESNIRDLIIHITLLSQKLYLRNMRIGNEHVDDFIKEKNSFIIKIGYKTLNLK